MFKNPDLFELDLPTRQAIYQAAQTDLDCNHNLSWRDSILNHAEREFKGRLAGYISHLEHKSEQDSATVLGQAQRIASLLDQVSELVQANKELKAECDELEDSLSAWRRNAELADQDNRRLEQENKELKKEVERLRSAHESTVYFYSLASKKG